MLLQRNTRRMDPDDYSHQSRLSDAIPEKIPTALARDLVNHYPADVKANADRLATLAGTLLARERADARDERARRVRETAALRARADELDTALVRSQAREAASRAQLAEIVALVGRGGWGQRKTRRRLLRALRRAARGAPAPCE